MKYLLDTHTFIWLDGEPERLSNRVSAICADDSNMLLLSLASVWEMQIKIQLGKLKLNSPLEDVISANEANSRIELLPIHFKHILTLDVLPDHHRDPFDRMLVAQSIAESMALLSNDPKLQNYPIRRIW
jgi:Uncharacterized protein conserved in bacteria